MDPTPASRSQIPSHVTLLFAHDYRNPRPSFPQIPIQKRAAPNRTASGRRARPFFPNRAFVRHRCAPLPSPKSRCRPTKISSCPAPNSRLACSPAPKHTALLNPNLHLLQCPKSPPAPAIGDCSGLPQPRPLSAQAATSPSATVEPGCWSTRKLGPGASSC